MTRLSYLSVTYTWMHGGSFIAHCSLCAGSIQWDRDLVAQLLILVACLSVDHHLVCMNACRVNVIINWIIYQLGASTARLQLCDWYVILLVLVWIFLICIFPPKELFLILLESFKN